MAVSSIAIPADPKRDARARVLSGHVGSWLRVTLRQPWGSFPAGTVCRQTPNGYRVNAVACQCPDYAQHGNVCKHVRAVRLFEEGTATCATGQPGESERTRGASISGARLIDALVGVGSGERTASPTATAPTTSGDDPCRRTGSPTSWPTEPSRPACGPSTTATTPRASAPTTCSWERSRTTCSTPSTKGGGQPSPQGLPVAHCEASTFGAPGSRLPVSARSASGTPLVASPRTHSLLSTASPRRRSATSSSGSPGDTSPERPAAPESLPSTPSTAPAPKRRPTYEELYPPCRVCGDLCDGRDQLCDRCSSAEVHRLDIEARMRITGPLATRTEEWV